MKTNPNILTKTLKHLPHYQYYLQQLMKKGREFVSNERLATDLGLSIPEVRRDLENLNESLGMAEIHRVESLISIVERYLGYDQCNRAIIAGAGNLGRALLNYPWFKTNGLDIIAIFDNDPALVGSMVQEKEVLHIERMEDLSKRLKVNIGIIATPPEPAQRIANIMVECGVQGIWNFSLAIIRVPEPTVLRNTSLYIDYLKLIQAVRQQSPTI